MVNQLKANGIITSMKSGKMTVAIKIAYRVKGANAVKDEYLAFDYSERTETKDIDEKFEVGDHVSIRGHVASYLRKTDGREFVNLYIDTIEPTKTDFFNTFGIEGGHYPPDSNSLCIEGIIDSVGRRGQGVEVRLDISDGKKNYITCIAYEKNAEAINSLAIGDRIYASVQIKPEDFKERSGKDFNKFFITAVAVAGSEKNGVEKVNRQQRNDGWESEFKELSEYLKKFEKNQ